MMLCKRFSNGRYVIIVRIKSQDILPILSILPQVLHLSNPSVLLCCCNDVIRKRYLARLSVYKIAYRCLPLFREYFSGRLSRRPMPARAVSSIVHDVLGNNVLCLRPNNARVSVSFPFSQQLLHCQLDMCS